MRNDGSDTATSARPDYDPLVVHARRELFVTLLAFVFFGVWVIGVSWWMGREPVGDPEAMRTVAGIPAWVFWGVAVPWLAANVFTFWFCFRYMAQDDLQEAAEIDLVRDSSPRRKETST